MFDHKKADRKVLVIVNAIAPYCFELNNVLAMPLGFNYRFRYRRFWMPSVTDPNELVGLPLLIILRIFETGELVPLREATIWRISEVGDVVHIEYKLGAIVRIDDAPNQRTKQISAFTKSIESLLGEYPNTPGADLRNLVLIAAGSAIPGEQRGPNGADEWGALVAFLITLKVFDGIDFVKVIGMRTLDGHNAKVATVADRRGFSLQRKTPYRLSVLQRTNVDQVGDSSVPHPRALLLTAASGLTIPFGRLEIRGKYDVLEFVVVTEKAEDTEVSLLWLTFDQQLEAKRCPAIEIPVRIGQSKKERVTSFVSLVAFIIGAFCLFYPEKLLSYLNLTVNVEMKEKVKNLAVLIMLFASNGVGEIKKKIIDFYKPKG